MQDFKQEQNKYKRLYGITLKEYSNIGLPYPRRRTSVDEDGYMQMFCYDCKGINEYLEEYNKDNVIEGYYGCPICNWHNNKQWEIK